MSIRPAWCLALLLLAPLPLLAETPTAPADLASRLDALLARSYPAAEPGAAALVEKDGRVILRKGYGMASLELGVPMRPEMVFKIGSLTKQFTALAILKLAEQGKLSLDDDITRFLPGYPTHGHLALWERALASGKLLRKDLLDRIFTPYRLRDGRSTNYGYGWELWTYEGHRVAEHEGVLNGFQAEILTMPEDYLLIVILSNNLNHAPTPATLAGEMAAEAIGIPLAARKSVPVAPEALDSYVGVYRIDPTTTRTVTREGDRLFTQRTGSPKLEILCSGGDEFLYRETMERLLFQRDGTGKVTGMVLDRRYGGEEVAVWVAGPGSGDRAGTCAGHPSEPAIPGR